MSVGLIGRKAGMTRVFTEDGVSVPVTVIEVDPNRVTQVKTAENDGYQAIQVTTGTVKANRLTKPKAGHYAKANVEAGRGLWEFRLSGDESINVGDSLTVERFEVGQKVDVTGTSKGKGFQGAVKRWNFQMQDATHGNSLSHVPQVQSANAKHLVVFGKARKWQVRWVTCKAQCKLLKLYVSMQSVAYY